MSSELDELQSKAERLFAMLGSHNGGVNVMCSTVSSPPVLRVLVDPAMLHQVDAPATFDGVLVTKEPRGATTPQTSLSSGG